MSEKLLVFITSPDEDTSVEIANMLVGSSLAACVNIVPKIRSIYKWDGEICDEIEQLMVVKTTEDKLSQLVSRVKQAHPFDVPETIAVKVVGGNQDYLKWVDESCK